MKADVDSYYNSLSAGTGMSSDYNDSESTNGTDGKNATYFRPTEAPPDKQSNYRRLWGYNEDLRTSPNNANKNEHWRRDRVAKLEAIASTLELNDTQKREAKHIMNNLDLTEDLEGRYSSLEEVSFAICAAVFNRTVQRRGKPEATFIPQASNAANPSRYVDLQQELGTSDQRLGVLISQIMRRITDD